MLWASHICRLNAGCRVYATDSSIDASYLPDPPTLERTRTPHRSVSSPRANKSPRHKEIRSKDRMIARTRHRLLARLLALESATQKEDACYVAGEVVEVLGYGRKVV